MDESDFEKLNGKVKLRRTYTKVFPYKSQYPIETLGEFRTDIKCKTNNGRKSLSNILIHVVKRNGNFGESLLSFQTAEDLGLVQIIKQVMGQTATDKLVSEYNDLFTGLGKMTDFQVKLHIDETVQPVAQPHRRIPFHIRKKVEKKIAEMEAADIIEKVDEATPTPVHLFWVLCIFLFS
ncbi:uncharacterized protein LOC102808870 [Saccoglossus kowalevskii]|uniref:Uncharacterized protein LOC102808870 n=1 Tax=Saccoglossus kowalevskii TaxID=10224 RepID=A0ABM0MCC5_SACKO|nr:PREDICTED: uncharacterized protein LOC102808870 [Saccoglossus kowalevskii]